MAAAGCSTLFAALSIPRNRAGTEPGRRRHNVGSGIENRGGRPGAGRIGGRYNRAGGPIQSATEGGPTMEDGGTMARRRVQIVNGYGLHMRPATKFVTLAKSFQSEVQVEFQGVKANGKSLLDMACLAAECGTTIELEATGPDAEKCLDALAGLVAAGFYMTDEDYRQPPP